ncbi:hypothetical protein [Streptomyces sp. 8N706]|uniref:hypothetical protein n=1 Tax=Streptomyces sp. 8N706 TaxID=3457416 RepID=UPI003FD144F7
MAKDKHPPAGEGPTRHKGKEQHGWAPDAGKADEEVAKSARRSFETGKHGGGRGKGREESQEEKHGTTEAGRSDTRGGEETGRSKKGFEPTGPKGRSRRPAGRTKGEEWSGVGEKPPPVPKANEDKDE